MTTSIFVCLFLKIWSDIALVALELLHCQGSSPVSSSMEIGLQASSSHLFNVVLRMGPRASCVPHPLPAELHPQFLLSEKSGLELHTLLLCRHIWLLTCLDLGFWE